MMEKLPFNLGKKKKIPPYIETLLLLWSMITSSFFNFHINRTTMPRAAINHLLWIVVGNEFDSDQHLSVIKTSCVLITSTILPPADMSFYYNNKEKSKSDLVND